MKHSWDTLKTNLIHPWNTVKTFLISLNHHWNIFEICLNHAWNMLETYLKRGWNIQHTDWLTLSLLEQTWKKFVSFRDPSLEFIIISAKYPTKNQQFRHFTQIDDWFLLQNCQNTLYFIILSTKEVLFLLKTSILLQLWKKFSHLNRNFRDPGSRGSRVFACLQTIKTEIFFTTQTEQQHNLNTTLT